MANSGIGVRGWRNYSTFSLFGAGSQRADRNTSILVDTYSGNLGVLAVDWNLAARIPCSLARAYNHQDSTTGVDRPFGPGWSWQFDMNLTGSMTGAGNVTWKAADGSEYEFTYSSGPVWTAPAGMSKYKLTYASGTPNVYTLTFGRMKYVFEANTTDSVARLTKIEDAFGNALVIDRTYSSSMPTAVINYIQIKYHNGTTWTTQNIVQPTYTGGLITKLRLLDSLSGGDYIDLHYSYSTIDGADRLIQVTPKRGTTALNLEVKYDYDSTSTKGLEMTKLYDSLGAQAGSPYYWQATYSSGKVASVVFPIDGTPTTGTVTYTYATSAPTSWSHSSPSAWNKVTDAESNNWYYGQDASGRVVFAVDPLWVNSTHESYTEYSYNSENQVTSVKAPKPNDASGQVTTSYYYDSSNNLAAVVDPYGFVSWYKYGSRASYSTSGTGATVDDIIGVFTPMPNQKAYSDTDYTASETTPPSLSSPLSVDSFVSWDTTNLYWKYTDGSGSPKTIKLVRSVMDYTFATGTGKLTQLLSCSPENFAESTATSYTLTAASACSKQEFGSTVGDLSKTYTPRQFKDSSLKWTAYTYDQTYGVVTAVEAADSISATANKKTLYTYNALKTRVTKVQLPQDNTNQWTETIYDADTQFALSVKRKDIQSWGIDPIVSISVFDNNGNLTQSWQAKPAGTPANWNGSTGSGGYDQVAGFSYDRLNRLIQSDQKVDWNQDGNVDTLSTYFTYDKNGRQTRVKGPGYDVSGTTYYSYSFTEYDADGRTAKSYNMVASTNSNLTSVPGGTKYVSYDYDLSGNVKALYNQLWTSGDYYKTVYTYDWRNAQIKTSAAFSTTGTGSPLTTEQHFGAGGELYWSQDGRGYKMYPQNDKNGRLVSMHRGSSGGDGDLREYDYNGNLQYYYSYKDVNTDSSNYRTRSTYDLLDRQVNSGRERKVSGSWQDWNENVADTTFNYNGWTLKTYDKVNAAGTYFTERVYDNWGQLTSTKLPQVQNSSGSGTVVYEPASTYDVLGRRTVASDAEGNDTTYTYDLLGRVIKVTDALSYETKTYFDARGNVKEVQFPSSSINKYTYNDRNLLSTLRVSHDSQNDDTTYTYDDAGRLTQTDFPDGGMQSTTYDQLGRGQAQSVQLDVSIALNTSYEYNKNNQRTLVTLPGSYTNDSAYDDLGNLTTYTDSNGDDTTYTYDKDNRRLTETKPNGLVTTWSYDWKTGNVSSVLYERNTTSGDDITVSYTYDDNGSLTTLTDGRGYSWTKAYDAMGRMVSLTTPNPGGGAYTHSIWYNGSGSMTKTTDFKGVSHYYAYDALGRMTGHGSTSSANDETYTWGCCARLTAYSDALGTASLSYDNLNRLTSQTDSNGNNVAYEYDALGRVTKLTPAQGSSYRSEYTYYKNGALKKVKVYDAGTAADTDYTYDSTSGQLTRRDFPVNGFAQRIRTTYAYDSAGRLEYETQTREAGGSTNLYKTQYAYSYIAAGSGGGRQLVRTEQSYSGGAWVNDNKLTYKYDALERLTYEERHDWASGAWSTRYDTTQAYDKNGNRTGYDKNVASGYESSYGNSKNLTYTYNAVNYLTQITDADDSTYLCALSSDDNGNITQMVEQQGPSIAPVGPNKIYTYYAYDALNRLTSQRNKAYEAGSSDWRWTKRAYVYDALGRLVITGYSSWLDGSSEPALTALQHSYAGRQLSQLTDGTDYSPVWHWAGARHSHGGPLKSPNADSRGHYGYNIGAAGGDGDPQRRTWLDATTEGDQRLMFADALPEAKDASGGGANWSTGVTGDIQVTGQSQVESRLVYQGTVEPGDLERAADARPGGKIGVLGSELNHSTVGGLAQSGPLGRSVNSPLIAWAPGMEPPGWGEQPYLPMKAYLPGQEPPGFNEAPWQLTRAELGPGGEVIIPGTGPWRLTGAQTDIAWAPGMEPPGWGEQPYLPMMAYAGEDPWAGLPWWIGRPMGATALVARPGDDPPPPPNQWNWREARPEALGASPMGLGASALEQGGYEMGPYRPPDTGLSEDEWGFVQRELMRWGRGIGMGALGGAGMGYYGAAEGAAPGGGVRGTITATDGSRITGRYVAGQGATRYNSGREGVDNRPWWQRALDWAMGVANWLHGAYVSAATHIQNGIDWVGSHIFGQAWYGFKAVVKSVWDNPVFQAATLLLDWEAVLPAKLLKWLGVGLLLMGRLEVAEEAALYVIKFGGITRYIGISSNPIIRIARSAAKVAKWFGVERRVLEAFEITERMAWNYARALETHLILRSGRSWRGEGPLLNIILSYGRNNADFDAMMAWAAEFATNNNLYRHL